MQTDVLHTVQEGMKVYDARNQEIGRVDWVQYGNDDPATDEIEAQSTEGMDEPHGHTAMDAIIDAFRVDDLPEEVRDRLLMQGFLRIDAEGLFAADRYVVPEQIGSVSEDGVVLTVEKDALLKRH